MNSTVVPFKVMKQNTVWIFVVAFLASPVAIGSYERTSDFTGPRSQLLPANTKRTEFIYKPESRWRAFGSGLAGYGSSQGDDFIHAPNGEQLLISGVLSYKMPNWVHDFGLGWMNSKLRTQTPEAKVSISTRAAVAEYGVRARLGKRWELGPEINLAFGTDTTFSTKIGPTSVAPFLGGRLVYEIPVSHMLVRLVTKVMTDMNLEGRKVTFAMIGVQLGLPFGMSKPEVESKSEVISTAANQVRIQMDAKRFHFYAKSSSLSQDARGFLMELAEVLKENQNSWKEIEIAGHADQRGARLPNIELSKSRADSIAEIFKSRGLDQDRMTVAAFGFDKPLDPLMNREAWARNRRVELIIDGVENPELLKQKLQAFNDQLRDRLWERKVQ